MQQLSIAQECHDLRKLSLDFGSFGGRVVFQPIRDRVFDVLAEQYEAARAAASASRRVRTSRLAPAV
ncbi:hypothetical protein G9444_3067 [Rhodococcus erythropolis]|uniref:Uncharacterized protein n=1 Tax=Rhodococcus erythropolis TaxID=1833 RepID=A0A6G9CUL6_RHOER|nr:hypothetical protein G9444_3067 [Rhodococcus erythropolis]